jgi:hypothetical protein
MRKIYSRLIAIIEEYPILRLIILLQLVVWFVLPMLPMTSEPIYEFGYVEYGLHVIAFQLCLIPFLAGVGLFIKAFRG